MPEDEEDKSGAGGSGRGGSSSSGTNSVSDETMTAPIKKLPVAAATLAKTWKENKRISKDDWQEWMRRLMIEVSFSLSPSPTTLGGAFLFLSTTKFTILSQT